MDENELLDALFHSPRNEILEEIEKIKDSDLRLRLLLQDIHPSYIPRLIRGLKGDYLKELISTSKSYECREEAIYRLAANQDYFLEILRDKSLPTSTTLEVINKIHSIESLMEIALETEDSTIGLEIPRKIKHPELNYRIFEEAKCQMARISAVKMLPHSYDPKLADWVVRGNLPMKLRITIIERIKDQDSLFSIWIYIDDIDIKQSIIDKFQDIGLLLSLKLQAGSKEDIKMIDRRVEELRKQEKRE